MLSALQDTKIWIKRKAVLTHNNKPVQVRIHIAENSIANSYLVIEELPNSFCLIPLTPEVGIVFKHEPSFQLFLHFAKYENIIISLTFSELRDLEILISHMCKIALLFSSKANVSDKFQQQNLAFLRKIKSAEPIKMPAPVTNSGSCTALSPIILDSETQKIWEKNIFDKNTQFYIKSFPLRISLLTWNVASGDPDTTVLPYLSQAFRVPASETDIVLIALQEIDMSMKSVVTGNTKASTDWRNIINQVTTKADFNVVATDSIGGVFCIALVKSSFTSLITNSSITAKKLGASGMLANKAALYFRFNLGYQTSFCIISCHLAPHDQNWEQRNSQWHEIMADLEPTDYVIFMGDLNYRIALDYDTVISYVKNKNLKDLINEDQLTITRKNDNVIGKFNEPEIKFNPTFKFDKNSDIYDTSPKKRIPSWTDRVLIRTADPHFNIGLEDILYFETDIIHHYMKDTGLLETDCFKLYPENPFNYPSEPECICYRNLKSCFSDHRPVVGVFRFYIPVVDNERKKELQDIIDAKYNELKKLSKPNIVANRISDNKILLSNQSLVWVQWNIKNKPDNVEIAPNKGILMVKEKVTLDVKCLDGSIKAEDTVMIDFESDNSLIVKLFDDQNL